jgi:uncharacterized iron-regulated protein
MKQSRMQCCIGACVLWLAIGSASAAPAMQLQPTPAALERVMRDHRVILLGETHDNAVQQALRLSALRQLIASGARPAIAFEQFDRDHQDDIDRARRERPRDARHLIERAAGDPGWNWDYYRPLVELALQYDLPIVAANLSRTEAMRVATNGWPAVFDPGMRDQLKLDALPADLHDKQQDAVRTGHCNLLPAAQLAPLVQAQIARDIVIAHAIRPYFKTGVVLLAGNGHVRRDIGVPRWLPGDWRTATVSIGLLERDESGSSPTSAENFDAYVLTEPAERSDPCVALRKRFQERPR